MPLEPEIILIFNFSFFSYWEETFSKVELKFDATAMFRESFPWEGLTKNKNY